MLSALPRRSSSGRSRATTPSSSRPSPGSASRLAQRLWSSCGTSRRRPAVGAPGDAPTSGDGVRDRRRPGRRARRSEPRPDAREAEAALKGAPARTPTLRGAAQARAGASGERDDVSGAAAARLGDPDERAGRGRGRALAAAARLDDFVGQDAAKEQLAVFIEAAQGRGEALDHVLLAGPPGLGKTSLAHIIATELGVQRAHDLRPALERKGDVAGLLTKLERGDVLFIDEIHRLNARGRGDPLPGDGGLRARHLIGQGPAAREHHARSSRRSRWSARRRAPACSRRRCATASASGSGSSTTTPTELARDRPALGRHPRRRDRRRRRRARSPAARAARRASPTACCGACATSPRCGTTGVVDARHGRDALELLEVDARGPRPARPRLLLRDRARSSTAARSASTRSPSPSARRPTRSRTSTSRTCFMQRLPQAHAARPGAHAQPGYRHCGLSRRPPRGPCSEE